MGTVTKLGRLAASGFALLTLVGGAAAAVENWVSPVYNYLYQFPMPIPPIKVPKMTVQNPVTGLPIDFYEVNILPFKKQVYPNLGPAGMVGYDAISPGPTFRVERGREIVVRFVNNGTLKSAVHLHGSDTRAPWDGWAEDTIAPGEYKDYYYPNNLNGRMLWYHDHAVDITSVNIYYGQAAAYIVHDPSEDALGLPHTYGVDDIPLMLTSKRYNPNGTLFSPAGERISLFGDVIEVNGQPWPYLKVQPKKYRFRLLDSAISRTFSPYFVSSSGLQNLPFRVIGTDAGLTTSPVNVTGLDISMGERYEIIVDFSPYAGQNITMMNHRNVGVDTDYPKTDQVMRFVVSAQHVADTTTVPAALRVVPFPPANHTQVDRRFRFDFEQGEWKINGVTFSDVAHRILARPVLGTVETWELVNTGPWSHPVHVHLVDFKVVSRTGGPRGGGVKAWEAQGLKDVVWLDVGETVRVEAHYAPWDGLYMFHCHNVVHEDHDMMVAFNVTELAGLGYNVTDFADPMDPRWRAVPAKPQDFTPAAITAKVQYMAKLRPYDE